MSKYREYNNLNLTDVANEVQQFWDENNIFEKSITQRDENNPYVFFEGPPSANGLPGIHHVMARAIKDIFCRYKTLKGYQVKRKAGWDTHGLPVELGVEKELGITKEDIGKKISVDEYNKACREAVMRYTDVWNDLTKKMGYWVDMEHPYVTYENKYIESVWWLLGQMYNKNLLYKGYTIQPYSPAAGTGLSTHELNQPGCYRDVKDTTVVAQFKVKPNNVLPENTYFLAWTTTPWTLPSNTALCVGPEIDYVLVKSINQYTKSEDNVVLAKNLLDKHFPIPNVSALAKQLQNQDPTYSGNYLEWAKNIASSSRVIIKEFKGSDLVGIEYEQLLPYALPYENTDKAFRVIADNFVTTEDGTGIVHIAPTFGADDARVAKENGVPAMLVLDENNNPVPLVDLQGRFRKELTDEVFGLGGEYVKAEYLSEAEKEVELAQQQQTLKTIIPELKNYLSVDDRITLKLKIENKAFKIEKYEHSYPHCWRTDKPVLYYPLDSWFIKVTEKKERLVELNKTINWKPESTGTGRFGNWLENANDWNLSRSRYWGIPIPIWRTEDGSEALCIESAKQLKEECQKAVEAGLMKSNPLANFNPEDMSDDNYHTFDLHKNYVDEMILVSSSGKPMKREADLIDVWFDSGSMPYAQWHYPFENKELIDNHKAFPADFIAEGVDQTRGWFYTLHAIGTMVFDSVAYKNVISNGLVLDKNGQKMSKRLGNAVDPFETLKTYSPDATRWYMITNAQPWDNLKFDLDGITEVQRKFFRALHSTYSFFALYANVDGFTYKEADIDWDKLTNLDKWIKSKLNTLIKQVDEAYSDYEPTKAGRLIQDFVVDQLSNWYVRLCRRRFWKGDYTEDKIAAYQTLYECLVTVAKLASPIAPFYSEQLFKNLNSITQKEDTESVHLTLFPKVKEDQIDSEMEERMDIAQIVSSMVLGLRKKENIRVRQPLQKIMIPVLDNDFEEKIQSVEHIIKSETNIKEIELLKDSSGVLVKNIKPNFKALGPKVGKHMKVVSGLINNFNQQDISQLEQSGTHMLEVEGEKIEITLSEVEISSQDIPGWLVANEGKITVALDITLTDELKNEGLAREFVNRIQNIRKDSGLEVTDKILLKIKTNNLIETAINTNKKYICDETLANNIELVGELDKGIFVDLGDGLETTIVLKKME